MSAPPPPPVAAVAVKPSWKDVRKDVEAIDHVFDDLVEQRNRITSLARDLKECSLKFNLSAVVRLSSGIEKAFNVYASKIRRMFKTLGPLGSHERTKERMNDLLDTVGDIPALEASLQELARINVGYQRVHQSPVESVLLQAATGDPKAVDASEKVADEEQKFDTDKVMQIPPTTAPLTLEDLKVGNVDDEVYDDDNRLKKAEMKRRRSLSYVLFHAQELPTVPQPQPASLLEFEMASSGHGSGGAKSTDELVGVLVLNGKESLLNLNDILKFLKSFVLRSYEKHFGVAYK